MTQPSRLVRFFAELRRRRVFRAAAAYLVVAWVVIEVSETILPHLGLPDWAVTLVIAMAAAGLPLALVLAWAVDLTPQGLRRAGPEAGADAGAGASAGAGAAAGGPARLWLTAALAAVVLLGGLAAWSVLGAGADDTLEDDVVVILPFRAAGADPELAYLSEGLLDLLSLTMSGGGARAVDARAVLGMLERLDGASAAPALEDAREVARRLDAARLLTGRVVGTPEQLTITASLVDTRTGRTLAQGEETGRVDSLRALVDRLSAALLSLQSGEEEHRLASLTTTSLPALRSYLDGQSSYRRAHYVEALRHYSDALDRDSTFAAAALGVLWTVGWILDPPDVAARAQRLAWDHRDRLSPRDRAYLRGLVGPNYPAPSSYAARRDAWERATEESSDRAEVWYHLGDLYFHYGRALGAEDWRGRARAALARAVAMDSSWSAPLQHLIDLAYMDGDAEQVEQLTELLLSREARGPWAQNARVLARYAAGDSVGAVELVEERLDEPEWARSVYFYSGWGDEFPMVSPQQGARAIAVITANAASRSELRSAHVLRHNHALNRGWPDSALAAVRALESLDPQAHEPRRMLLTDALYWDGLTEPAEEAAVWLHERLRGVASGGDRDPSGPGAERSRKDACALGQWYALRGETAPAQEVAQRLREHPHRDTTSYRSTRAAWETDVCLAMIEAVVSSVQGRRDIHQRVERLEEVLDGGAPLDHDLRAQAALVLASLLEATGRVEAALAATRTTRFIPGGELYRPTLLRERARLAAAAGRTGEAVEAYRRYLVLRREASPELEPQLDDARRALVQLVDES